MMIITEQKLLTQSKIKSRYQLKKKKLNMNNIKKNKMKCNKMNCSYKGRMIKNF